MDKEVIKTLEDIKKSFNNIVFALVTLYLFAAINYMNSKYFEDDSPIEFMKMKIYPEYISFFYGVLCFALIMIVYLKIHQLSYLILDLREKNQGSDLSDSVKLFQWIASPFHQAKSGLWIFRAIMLLAGLQLLLSSIGHIFSTPSRLTIPIQLFRQIGYIDAVLLLISIPFIIRLFQDVNVIRKALAL